MEHDPDFGEIPDYLAERLRAAEARFREARGERNPLAHLPRVGHANIFGTEFSAYDARGTDTVLAGVDGATAVPTLALYSTQPRFHGMCDLICRRWVPELVDLVAALSTEETRSEGSSGGRAAAAVDDTGPEQTAAQATLDSFGLQVVEDCYIVGYRDARSPLIVRKALILKLLELVAVSLTGLEIPAGSRALEILKRYPLTDLDPETAKMN